MQALRRVGGFGLSGMYIHSFSRRLDTSRNLGALGNTASDEYHATYPRNVWASYFMRRQPCRGDFYRIGTRQLGQR